MWSCSMMPTVAFDTKPGRRQLNKSPLSMAEKLSLSLFQASIPTSPGPFSPFSAQPRFEKNLIMNCS